MSGRVVVVGSINVDLVVSVPHLPAPGETVLGGTFVRAFGGKGANQAVAAARAGASVRFVGAVGSDADGDLSIAALAAEGVDVEGVERVDAPTGMALIAVGPGGENQIVVAPGANRLAGSAAARAAAGSGDVLLASLEIPMAVVVAAVTGATAAGILSVVNPAPAQPLPDELLSARPILTPNERELATLVGTRAAARPVEAAELLLARGCSAVALTRGAAGALLVLPDERTELPGHPVPRAVDTTGAGDTFAGVLAAWLADGTSLLAAAQAANAAAALSVTAPGARAGMPRRGEILALLG